MKSEYYTPEEISRLIFLALKGVAEPEQEARLAAWLEESEANRKFYARLKDKEYRLERLREFGHYDSFEDWEKIETGLCKSRRIRLRKFRYAAILAIILGGGGYFLYLNSFVGISNGSKIEAGHYQARLLLPEGGVVALGRDVAKDSLALSVLREKVETDGRELIYGQSESTNSCMHVLQVPRGGEYRIVLSDGTRVWLNADTELSYPAHFTGNERRVSLSGEAYFEVVRDKAHPFYVEAGGMEIRVLGTSFNISAYREESYRATLVEGKVEIASAFRRIELFPGEQAFVEAGSLEVRQVNVENYTGWRSRKFIYEDEVLEEVFRDLERWYDVEINFGKSGIGDLHFTANISKDMSLNEVLDIIAYAACVKFEIKERKITVLPDKSHRRI